jgi:phytoene synthase
MVNSKLYSIFKGGSRTYFYSSIFFPMDVRHDVFVLYSFVRTADNFVDAIPQETEQYFAFKKRYDSALVGHLTGDIVVDSFVDLMKRRSFEKAWLTSFFDSMMMDIERKCYATLGELEVYIHGSAEVVGLMMSRILGLNETAYPCARQLGKAMQYINFVRDIAEDLRLGRVYLPQDEIAKHGLESLNPECAAKNSGAFRDFMAAQVRRFEEWQNRAERGFRFIPKKYVIPVMTASEMYKWTAKEIMREPMLVYRKTIKPPLPRIFWCFVYSTARYR